MMRRTSSTSQKVLALLSPSKERMNLDMKRALDLLNLRSIDALEQRFLSLPAFLEPWVSFRDSFLLLQKGGMPRTTSPGQIDGPALLYYYTLYDEGMVRYDNRVNELSSVCEKDLEMEKYRLIDKSTWGVVEYEKLLYVWLLQAWRVGKKSNSGEFAYFVHKSQVTAWREVFVPIVNAVRDSYDIKGRRHYGRLAKFLEEIAPSRLAFPENNVGVGIGTGFAPPPTTPYRLVSRPLVRKEESSFFLSSLIKKKQYDDTEKELRDVYPQYGQLVERPKNMNVVKDFLESQRQKKEVEKARCALEGTPEKSVPLARRISTSTLFRRSSILRNKAHKNDCGSEPRSPVNGVERQLSLPQTPTKMVARSPFAYDDGGRAYAQRTMSIESSKTLWPSQSRSQYRSYGSIRNTRKASNGVYTSIRNSSPHDETPDRRRADDISSFASKSETYPLTPIPRPRMASTSTTDSISNYPPSTIPRALFSQGNKEQYTSTGRVRDTKNASPTSMCDSRQSSRSGESKRAVKTSSIRPPSSLTAYLGQEIAIPEETSHIQSPSDENSGCIHPALRESPYTGKSLLWLSPNLPNEYQESIHPALRNAPRATNRTATRIPSPTAAYDGREYGAPYDEYPRPSTASKNRVHTTKAGFDEPQHIKQEGTIHTGRPKVTRIPTTLYQYIDCQEAVKEEPFQPGAPPKARQHVAKAKSHADLSPSNEPPPPLPFKSPRRITSVQSNRGTASYSRQHHVASKSSHNLVVPAVSIDNIRAALGSPDRSSSEDEEEPQHEPCTTSGSGDLTRLGGGHTGGPLRTYNSHMFPRHRSEESSLDQVQADGAVSDSRYEADGAYEMEFMKGGGQEGQKEEFRRSK